MGDVLEHVGGHHEMRLEAELARNFEIQTVGFSATHLPSDSCIFCI